jgi:hypothetical protein
MKPCGSIQVVKMWCDICTDPVLRCFNNPEGLSFGNLIVGMVLELANGLRLVPSQDLSVAWVSVRR